MLTFAFVAQRLKETKRRSGSFKPRFKQSTMDFFKPAQQGPTPLQVAKIEAEILTDLFNKMSSMCFQKCVTKYNNADLQVGEMACTDRCVSKYMLSQEVVSGVLNKFQKQVDAQGRSWVGQSVSHSPFPNDSFFIRYLL